MISQVKGLTYGQKEEVLEFEAGYRGDVSRQEEDEGEYAPELACRRGFLAPWRPSN